MRQERQPKLQLAATLAAITLLAMLTTACAPPARGIQASGVWARAAQAGAIKSDASVDSGMNSAIYMVLANGSATPDRLLSAAADVAGAVEIHESSMDGDVMRMQQLSDGIEIPANGQVELKPGGLHVMLIGLTRDLNPGETFPLTLQFEQAGAVTVEAEVREP